MKLYLVRHLPTPWNAEGRLQGNRDIPIIQPLSAESADQISKNKILLSNMEFDGIFASQKLRTQQTAAAYGFTKFEVTALLNELDFGPYEGKLKSEAMHEMGKNFLDDPFKTVLRDHYQTLEKNIRAFLNLTRDKKNILVFGHGSFIRGTKCLLDHGNLLKINSFPLSNNEIVVLESL